jgi:YYY domain-containing protein
MVGADESAPWTRVFDALRFWLAVEVLGLLALPLCAFVFSRLPGGGLAFARPLGLLVASYPAWLLASVGIMRYRGASIGIGAAALALASALAWRTTPRARVRRGTALKLWAAGGALFAAAFFGWTLLRSFAPDVWQTEKPMDMAFVNSIQRSGSLPPPDPWFSGHTLNYYYYGHYLAAFVARAAHVGSTAGFNLAVALFYALSALTVFGVASALYLAGREGARAPRRSAVLVGLAAAAFAVVAGNIAGTVEYLQHPSRFLTYDWFAPSRVIDGTANEFPFFSFLLADLHAHAMAAPFALLVLAYSLQLCIGGPPRRSSCSPGSRSGRCTRRTRSTTRRRSSSERWRSCSGPRPRAENEGPSPPLPGSLRGRQPRCSSSSPSSSTTRRRRRASGSWTPTRPSRGSPATSSSSTGSRSGSC